MPVVRHGLERLLPGSGPKRQLGRGVLIYAADSTPGNIRFLNGAANTQFRMPGLGSYLATVGATGWGTAWATWSIYHGGLSKSGIVGLYRDGVLLNQWSAGGLSDNASGSQYSARYRIPPWSRGAVYEWRWQFNGFSLSGSNGWYTAGSFIHIPSYEYRGLDYLGQSRVGWTTQHVAQPWADYQEIASDWSGTPGLVLQTQGPTLAGSATLVWSVYAQGCNKAGTRVWLYRDQTALWDSGSFSPLDATSGSAYSWTIAIPPWPRAALYRWIIYVPCTYTVDDGLRRLWINSASIVVPPKKTASLIGA